jgi:hypothetical protein
LTFEAAWRTGLKNPEEVMEILEAFDLTGTLRGAAQLAGCDHKTVALSRGPAGSYARLGIDTRGLPAGQDRAG